MAASADGRPALSDGRGRTIRVWDVNSAKQLRLFGGHTGSLFAVAFRPDGKTLVCGGYDRVTRTWELNNK